MPANYQTGFKQSSGVFCYKVVSNFFMVILSTVNFLAAFLLFQLELIVAKLFLPAYGGSYSVWGACVVFFQATLLLGYVYVHWITKTFPFYKYARWHFLLFSLSLLGFPRRLLVFDASGSFFPFVIDVFLKLSFTIGPVFFVLSTMSVFSQRWLMSSRLAAASDPYRLYAYSNFGSFAALLSYPFFFEYYFDLKTQQMIWRGLYILLVVVYALAYFRIPLQKQKKEEEEKDSMSLYEVSRCFLLAAAGVMAFLAVTNILTYEVGPIPLLWIVPLGIYLLSFVLNFKKRCWCPRWISSKLHITLALSLLLFFFLRHKSFPLFLQLLGLCFLLFILCMYCQNQLINHKPQTKSGLTKFYVTISLGSFLGGVVVSWIIPVLFFSYIEFPLSLFIIVFTMMMQEIETGVKRIRIMEIFYIIVVALTLLIWPTIFKHYHALAFLFLVVFICLLFIPLNRNRRALAMIFSVVIVLMPYLESAWTGYHYIDRVRNYYGIYEVIYEGGIKALNHGQTLHGMQSMYPPLSRHPLGYYGHSSSVGEVLRSEHFQFKNIGAIGLGVGTFAPYLKSFQTMDFFELDKDVYKIAKKYFTYLDEAEGQINYFIGDARLTLDKMDKRYDLIIADAFSSDAVPFHLLTAEMMLKYRAHLMEKGLVAFHISNRYLNFVPVLANTAYVVGAKNCFKYTEGGGNFLNSHWFAITWNEETFRILTTELKWVASDPQKVKLYRPWTDQYSNVLKIVKTDELLNTIKNFNYFSMK